MNNVLSETTTTDQPRRSSGATLALLFVLCLATTQGHGALAAESQNTHHSLADTRWAWPDRDQVLRVVTLRDYNTRIILLGTTLLGLCSAVVGTFTLLRGRALIGDVVSHAALPGIGIAFLIMEHLWPGQGKSFAGLLLGATISGLIGIGCTRIICRTQRIREDAALAIVLSLFFGLGIALFTVIQKIPTGTAAGLNDFIFGKTASIIAEDVQLIAAVALVVIVLSILLFKEFSLLAFDSSFAAVRGWPVGLLDALLMALVVSVTIIGLQSVGLLLVVALLIVPASAARFWSDRLHGMTLASATIGGLSAFGGVATSALFPRMAAGAIIVLFGTAMFTFSMFFGTRRGILPRLLVRYQVKLHVGRQNLLRALFECQELLARPTESNNRLSVPLSALLGRRSWNQAELHRHLKRAEREGLVESLEPDQYRFTRAGESESHRIARNHRLWELYLIHFAHIAPSHVDRNADQIEHVLDPEIVEQLELLLAEQHAPDEVPASPHKIDEANGSDNKAAG